MSGRVQKKDTQRAASPARLLRDSSTTLQLQRLISEEAPPKRLRPLATSPTICCPIRLRGQPTTRPIASPSPYSTGTRGATCSRGRRCHTRACSQARARAPAAPPSPRRRPGRARGCGRTRPASQQAPGYPAATGPPARSSRRQETLKTETNRTEQNGTQRTDDNHACPLLC